TAGPIPESCRPRPAVRAPASWPSPRPTGGKCALSASRRCEGSSARLRRCSRDLELDFENAMHLRLAEATFVEAIAPQLIVRIVTPFERRDTVVKVSDLAPEIQNRLVLLGSASGR